VKKFNVIKMKSVKDKNVFTDRLPAGIKPT